MGDKYNPLFELGAGSFGKAWVVKDTKTQKKYVSKVIQIKGLSSEALDRCVTEVAVLSACCHENIVRYLEAFVSNGALHIVMEYASGGDLQQKIEKQNGVLFTSDKILEWFLQVILALEYIHSKNILHRDLKPQNIFLTDIGVVKLGDFGIARVLNNCDDLASTRIGTPFYISPEICERKPYNSCSDMWAAGCLLYQMSMLRVPFHATNFDDLSKKIIKAQYDPIPSQFQGIIKELISKLLVSTPEHRLSASQLLRLESLRDIVLYLKSRNRRKGQGSRIRSNSLVTERSRLNLCPKARSSSVNRLNRESVGNSEVIFRKQHQDKYKGSDDVNIRNKNVPTDKNRICKSNVEGGSEQQCYSRGDEKCLKIDRDRIKEKHDRGANINDAEKLAYVNPSINKRSTSSVSNGADEIKAVEKSNNKEDNEKKKAINTKTYAIKDSVVKRLSQASPILAQTVRKQRFSLSISEADSSYRKDKNGYNGKEYSPRNQDHLVDEVFDFHDVKPKHRINSQTYTVKEKECRNDSNNNNMEGIQCSQETDEQELPNDHINRAMTEALSVFKFNKQFTKKILYDEMKLKIGDIQCDQLISQVRQLILEDGQSYQSLTVKLTDEEQSLIPLVCMYLTT